MSWKKHFRKVDNKTIPTLPESNREGGSAGTSSKYASYLPEVYAGHPSRIQRYWQYDDMDRDSDISAALDTIADFCTQSEEQTDEPFEVVYNDDEVTETEVKLLTESLKRWIKVNEFKKRIWDMIRNTIKNGDAFFLRDPETGEWLWIDHFSVEMVKVDETRGKEPDEYIVRGLDYNKAAQFATRAADPTQYRTPFGTNMAPGARPVVAQSGASNVFQMAGGARDGRAAKQGTSQADELSVVDADHVIHLSLSVGMDVNWPFGQSVLEPIYKTYKQKELLEDSIIIYRVQRAPERRIFHIDVGSMPPIRAKAHVEAIKNEIHQRRIPNRTGGGQSIMDAAYNPLTIIEDYFFAQTAEGRGSKVETLPGGDNLGEIGDLSFFTKKLARGLRIPSSYLALGDDEGGGAAYNDGKLGAAMIQEFRFTKYCMRIQNRLCGVFDKDFKRYLKESGIEIDSDVFELKFNPPQNFTKYRQIELDLQQMQVYQGVADNKKMAERFKFRRFLNLSEDEILENERLWREENAKKLKKATGSSPAESEPQGDLTSIGLRPDGGMDMGGEPMPDEGELGAEGGMDQAGGADAMGGAPMAGGGAPPMGGPAGGAGGAGGPL